MNRLYGLEKIRPKNINDSNDDNDIYYTMQKQA